MKRFRRAAAALGLIAATTLGGLLAQAPDSSASPFPNGRNPVVFVHGFSESDAMWDTMKQSLRQSGYTDDQLTAVDYNTTSQSNVATAEWLGGIVDEVLHKTGASKVDIVSHSMGSLNSRYCVKFAGCAGKTERWISLAGANKGTNAANLCTVNVTCREMVPGSDVLKRLNADPLLPPGTKWSTLWTPNDGIIVPATNTVLEGAENIQVGPGINHLNIFKDQGVIKEVTRLLAA